MTESVYSFIRNGDCLDHQSYGAALQAFEQAIADPSCAHAAIWRWQNDVGVPVREHQRDRPRGDAACD